MKEGTWAKEYGGHQGVVFFAGKWRRFTCVFCAKAQGLLKERKDWGELSSAAQEVIKQSASFTC